MVQKPFMIHEDSWAKGFLEASEASLGERILRAKRARRVPCGERSEPGERFMAREARPTNVVGRAKRYTKVLSCKRSEPGERFRKSEASHKSDELRTERVRRTFQGE